jgi:hypothetical protein
MLIVLMFSLPILTLWLLSMLLRPSMSRRSRALEAWPDSASSERIIPPAQDYWSGRSYRSTSGAPEQAAIMRVRPVGNVG